MEETTLHIKNMVCDRCIAAVSTVIRNLGLTPVSIKLGIAKVKGELDADKLAIMRKQLEDEGFMLLEDRQQQTVEKIKNTIIELVHYNEQRQSINLSTYLSEKMCTDYSSLSKTFSEYTQMTIERYFILQRVERVKELLFYDELSISEIATKMNYSSVAYLSTQFKNITGMTPSQFKATNRKELKQLDKI